jgi:hypothetical protein
MVVFDDNSEPLSVYDHFNGLVKFKTETFDLKVVTQQPHEFVSFCAGIRVIMADDRFKSLTSIDEVTN